MSRDRDSLAGETADVADLWSARAPRVGILVGADSRLRQYLTWRLRSDGWLIGVADTNVAPPAAAPTSLTEPHDEHSLGEAIRGAVTQLGPPSLLVTITDAPDPCPFTDLDAAQWVRLLDQVVGSSLTACRAIVPAMCRHGGGTVIAVSSAPPPGAAHYAAAHHTLLGMMRSLAIETAPGNVNVTTIAPNLGDDPGARDLITGAGADEAADAAVADTIIYLAGEGSFCTGQVMTPQLTTGAS